MKRETLLTIIKLKLRIVGGGMMTYINRAIEDILKSPVFANIGLKNIPVFANIRIKSIPVFANQC